MKKIRVPVRAQEKKEEHRCFECSKITPITGQFTRCADNAPLLGECPEKGHAVLLNKCACESFTPKIK